MADNTTMPPADSDFYNGHINPFTGTVGPAKSATPTTSPSATASSPNATGGATSTPTSSPSIASQFNVGTPQTGTTGTTASSGASSSSAPGNFTLGSDGAYHGIMNPGQIAQVQNGGQLNFGSSPQTGTTSSLPAQLNQAATYNVNDPNFQNMSADQRLNVFKSNPALAQQELERVKGAYNQAAGSGDAARLQQIRTWANQVRQASGIIPNDPFYGNGPAPTADGSLGLSVNGQQEQNIPVYQGTSFDDASKIAQELGVSYSRDPSTNMPIIGGKQFNAVTFDKNGNPLVPLKLVAESLGYQADYNPKTNSVTVTGGKQQNDQQGQPAGMQGFGMPQQMDPNALFNSYNSYANSMGLQQPNDFMPIQQQFNPDWSSYYNQAHAQIDPLYQSQMDTLMGKQASDISGMDQKMNARGIFNSGIAQAAEDDLRAKTTNSVATLLTKQMSDIEKTAQTLYSQAYKQYSDGNTFALKYNQDQISNYMAQQKQIFSQWLSTQKLDLSQQQYALNAWDKMATLQLDQTKSMLPYQYQTANNQANNQTSMNKAMLPYEYQTVNNQANNQASMDRALIPYSMGPTPAQMLPYNQMTQFQQAQTNQGQQKIDLQGAAQQAANYFKQLGINVDMGKLQEAIRHDQAGEQNTADANKIKMTDIMGVGPDGKTPTLNRQKLIETITHDNDLITIAKQNAKSTQEKNLLDGYGQELTAINEQFNSIMARHTDGKIDQGSIDYQNLTSLTNQRNGIINQLSKYAPSSQGSALGNDPTTGAPIQGAPWLGKAPG